MEIDCSHPVRLHGLCAVCGADISNLGNAALDQTETTIKEENVHILHSSLGLTVSPREAERIEKDLQTRLLKSGKLSLVLDLDQTVLHATKDPAIETMIGNRQDIYRITFDERMPDEIYYIKLRPGLERFLKETAKLFELHVYTMGTKSYARAVTRLFDPDGKYFYDRILSRDDSGIEGDQRKSLRRIFPADDSTVLIVDDRADVWDYCANLIPVPPYTFFMGVGDINRSLTTTTTFLVTSNEKNKDPTDDNNDNNDITNQESDDVNTGSNTVENVEQIVKDDSDDELEKILKLLESIHQIYFEKLATEIPNVKTIAIDLKRLVLSGVSLSFSGIIPLGMPPEKFELWRLATVFGAECTLNVSNLTTHLITFRTDTDKVLRATELGLLIVRPEWLFQCFKQWKHVDETIYLLKDPSTLTLNNSSLEDESTGNSVILGQDDLDAMNQELIELEQSTSSSSIEEEEDSSDEHPPQLKKIKQQSDSETTINHPNHHHHSHQVDNDAQLLHVGESNDSDNDSLFAKELEQDLL